MNLVCLAPLLRTKRIRTINGTTLNDRTCRHIRRVTTANRARASITNTLRRLNDDFRRMLKALLRNSASRMNGRLLLKILVKSSVLRLLAREVGNVIRNRTLTQILIMLVGSNLANVL